MQLALNLSYSGTTVAIDLAKILEAERLGYASVWTAEAYGSDAVVPAAWIAARTERIHVGTAIMQIPARTPAMTAMTAMTLDALSGGRFRLGLGVSGPQVVEGWHGQPFGKPLVRTREYVAIVRAIVRRERPLEFRGEYHQVPYAGPGATGLGKPLRSILHGRASLPIYLAAIGPRNVALAAVTEWTGRYALVGVPAGSQSVTVRMIGYRSKTVSDVVVQAGGATQLDVTLDAAVVELEGIVVSAEVERGSVSRALDEQRTATQIVSAISAEQIRHSPDGDAGQAVQRISGVTVQDGKYVFVRGLGERYTTTSLNNVRIPSPEPERKVVPLDLFPSGLLQSIVTSKTFTPEQPGDLSGAQVDLRTREFPTSRVLSLSLSTGVNDAVTFRPVLAAPRVGAEWWGFAGRDRALPAVADRSLAGLTQGEAPRDLAADARSAGGGSAEHDADDAHAPVPSARVQRRRAVRTGVADERFTFHRDRAGYVEDPSNVQIGLIQSAAVDIEHIARGDGHRVHIQRFASIDREA